MLRSLLYLAAAACTAVVANPFNPDVLQKRDTVSLPTSYQWTSTGALVGPKNDGRNVAGIKDPSVVFHNGAYHVFASTAQSSGYNLVYFSFTDFAKAGSATFHYLDQSGIGRGYRAAPQVFYFEPQRLWYLIYQNGNAAYSTNPDISNPSGWTAPKNFYSGTPPIITQNIGNGYWVDMWVICDSSNCHLFSSDDNGHLYRSQTSISNFPNGMNQPVIALSDPNKNRLFEACNVYHIGDGTYLLIVEAIGSDGNRYFRSWKSASISGPWTGLADSESNPFARSNNVAFSGTPWTKSISHGELIRTNVDQTLTVSPCDFRYLYQGLSPSASGDYNSLPWKLGLITLKNVPSACSDTGTTTTTTTTTTAPTTTAAPTTTTTTTTSSSPTTTQGGCVVSRWGQCGGNGWTGCTTCASGTTCHVQNPWYSQCL